MVYHEIAPFTKIILKASFSRLLLRKELTARLTAEFRVIWGSLGVGERLTK
jgi:hypothetical protein